MTLFNDDEHLPDSFPNRKTIEIAGLVGMVTFPMCPAFPEHLHRDDAFHQAHHYEGEAPSWIANGGSTNVNSFVPNNQTLDAANMVTIRRAWEQRDHVRRIAASTQYAFTPV